MTPTKEAMRAPMIGEDIIRDVDQEIYDCLSFGPSFASAHEAHGVLMEELDEFWEIVRLKRENRSAKAIRHELIQLAAMAIKAIHSIDHFVGPQPQGVGD